MASKSDRAGDNLEVEVKFLVDDLAVIRRRLTAAGADLQQARLYERNVRFDTPDEALRWSDQLLRLRHDAAVRLTFKGPSLEDELSEAKVREEIEVSLDDFDRMALILQRLGFVPLQVYEKYRETFVRQGVIITLDELPFGTFVELEGQTEELKATAAALGLDWSKRLLTNYLALMAAVKQRYNLPFDDLTFDNFRAHIVSWEDIL